jgi:ABC-type iron transport system FetAB permease component
MASMIIGVADSLEAVRLQMVVLCMLLGSVSLAAISVSLLSYRSFLNARHQLRDCLSADQLELRKPRSRYP